MSQKVTLYLPEHTVNILKSYPESYSKVVKKAVDLYFTVACVAVLRFKNTVNDCEYLTVVDSSWVGRSDIMAVICNQNTSFGNDYNKYGPGEFELTVLGAFKRKIDAVEYISFYLNRLLDNGGYCYNSEPYLDRWVRLKVDPNLWLALVKHCSNKKITVFSALKRWMSKFKEKK